MPKTSVKRQTATAPVEQWLSIVQLAAATGLSEDALKRLAADTTFPHPLHVGTKKRMWLLSEVAAWLSTRRARSASAFGDTRA